MSKTGILWRVNSETACMFCWLSGVSEWNISFNPLAFAPLASIGASRTFTLRQMFDLLICCLVCIIKWTLCKIHSAARLRRHLDSYLGVSIRVNAIVSHISQRWDVRAVNHSSWPSRSSPSFFPLALPHLLIKEPAPAACLRGHVPSRVSRNPAQSFLQIHANHNI